MFGLSSFELAMIGLVALIVLGPKRLPKAARTAGMLFRKAQRAWFDVRDEIERELTLDELKAQMREQESQLKQAQASIEQEVRSLAGETIDGLDAPAQEANDEQRVPQVSSDDAPKQEGAE